MANSKAAVLVGTPDVTGSIYTAATTATAPTDATSTLGTGFTACGYVSDGGLQLTPSVSTADIREWGGNLVRRIVQTFDGTLSWEFLQTDEETMKAAFGVSHVTVTAANQSHGKQLAVKLNPELPEDHMWVFNMKDGDARVRIVVPDGQVTTVGAVSFTSGDAVKWPITLSCYADAQGNCIYIYTDDGVTTA